MPPLPASVQEIADEIGREAALRLVGALPSDPARPWLAPLYVPTPARMRPTHRLMAILGEEDAMKLARIFGGEMLFVSKCRGLDRAARDRRIAELRAKGLTFPEIAGQVGATADTCKKAWARAGGNPPMET